MLLKKIRAIVTISTTLFFFLGGGQFFGGLFCILSKKNTLQSREKSSKQIHEIE